MRITDDEKLRAILLLDFERFTRYFFRHTSGRRFVVAEHHRKVIDALAKVARGEILRLIINIPPRYGKTELAVKMFIGWVLANNPAAKFIHLSYSDDLALDNSAGVRELVKHEEFQRLFPMPLKAAADGKRKWYTQGGGGVYATAAGSAVTGFGAGSFGRERDMPEFPANGFGGAIIIDDPLKPDDAFSDTARARINRRFNNTIASRVNSPETPIILIMQRLHEEDMTGFLLNGGSGEQWHHLCLSAVTDADEALWPEKHDRETLRRMEAADPYTFAGQYRQRPSPLGGGIIKGAWFGKYVDLPRIKWRKIYADTAQKTAERNDFSVFQCWGMGEDGRIYLLDQIRGKWEAPELRREAIAFWKKNLAVEGRGILRQMMVEDKASGTGLIQDIRRAGGVPIQPVERTKDKLTRVMDVVGHIASGNVALPANAAFTPGIVAECEAFTADDSHLHDDQVDPMVDAIGDMLAGNMSIWERLAQ